MNSNDIFRKSDLGREEIKSQSLGVLPREARTLLIMIDGKKTYQNYIDSLNESKMFAEFGGVEPLFELLLEFQCIELVGSGNASISAQPSAAVPPQSQPQSQPQPSPVVEPAPRSSEAEFDNTFNNQQLNEVTAIGNSKAKAPDANYDSLKSELATYIEKNAPPEEAWGYLLSLEQCEDTSQLLALTQDIQSSGNGNLSRGMDEFSKKIRRHL